VNEFELLDFHTVDLPVPVRVSQSDESVYLDKALKRLVGLAHAMDFSPRYIAMLDADDHMANDLAATIMREDSDGCARSRYLSEGYVFDYSTGKVHHKHGLQRFCGSTIIFSAEPLRDTFTLSSPRDPSTLFEANRAHARLLIDLLGNHQRPVGWLHTNGYPLRRHSSPAVCWTVNHGTNISGRIKMRNGLPLDAGIAARFSLASRARDLPPSVIGRIKERFATLLSLIKARRAEEQRLRRGDPGPPTNTSGDPELPE